MKLKAFLTEHEEWLIDRVIAYGKRQGYTQYASTLREAWRISVVGLSEAISRAEDQYGDEIPELRPDLSFGDDSVTAFGVEEARRHRTRGITLVMFLGLFKYYTQAFLDCVELASWSEDRKAWANLFVRRCMERIELAYCDEWSEQSTDRLIEELQTENRLMTNQKNMYLTIFESVRDPIVFLDPDGRVQTMNSEAVRLFTGEAAPRASYYEAAKGDVDCGWLTEEIERRFGRRAAPAGRLSEGFFVKSLRMQGGERVLDIKVSPMLDVSDKFLGSIVAVKDITELTRLATTDTLTGTHNRRYFLERAHEELKRSGRHDRPLGFLMLDVDHFKRVNDSFGHVVGDRVLQTLVAGAQATLRQTDIFGRIGGEEFAALMPETHPEEALFAAERLRRALAERDTMTPTGNVHVTVSIGLTHPKQPDETLEDLLERADRALYRAKQSGRNRVVQI